MKSYYEDRTKTYLTRRSHTIVRVDGKAFHTYTKGLIKPFDDGLMEDMDEMSVYLCEKMQGAKLAFVQSDEVSVLLTDFDDLSTDMWFDGGVQKICSVSASMSTMAFNRARFGRLDYGMRWAEFDARVFQIPEKAEVVNYFLWRQRDATRNSIQSVAQSLYSQKELHGKNISELQEMIFAKGINWNDYAPRYKRGRIVIKEKHEVNGTERSRWVVADCPTFKGMEKTGLIIYANNYLGGMIPDPV